MPMSFCRIATDCLRTRTPPSLLVGVVLGMLPLLTTPASAGQIRWLSGLERIQPQPRAEVAKTLAALATENHKRHLVVCFSRPVPTAERKHARSSGRHLVELPGRQRFFRLDRSRAARRFGGGGGSIPGPRSADHTRAQAASSCLVTATAFGTTPSSPGS